MNKKERMKLRRYRTLKKLVKEGEIKTKEHMNYYDITHPTASSDIERLAEIFPQVKEEWGGARWEPSRSSWPSSDFQDRSSLHREQKNMVAHFIAEKVSECRIAAVGGGTTMHSMVSKLVNMIEERMYIVTYSMPIIYTLAGCKKVEVIDTGGRLERESLNLRREEFSLAQLITSVGVTSKKEESTSCETVAVSFRAFYPSKKTFTSYSDSEPGVKKTLLNSSREVFIGLDASKIETGKVIGREWVIPEDFASATSVWIVISGDLTENEKIKLKAAKDEWNSDCFNLVLVKNKNPIRSTNMMGST